MHNKNVNEFPLWVYFMDFLLQLPLRNRLKQLIILASSLAYIFTRTLSSNNLHHHSSNICSFLKYNKVLPISVNFKSKNEIISIDTLKETHLIDAATYKANKF